MQSFGTRDAQQPFELRIPGFDAVLKVNGYDADVQGFDDIFAEILEAFDLHGLLLERMVEPGIFDGDGDVASDGEEQFEVVTGEVIAVDGFAQAENGDGTVVETTGDEIVQVELFERATDRGGLFAGGASGFKEQTAAFSGQAFGIQEGEIERAFRTDAHGAGENKRAGLRFVFEKNGEAVDE